MTTIINGNPIKYTSNPVHLHFDEIELRMLDTVEVDQEVNDTFDSQFLVAGATAGVVFIVSLSIAAIFYFIKKRQVC